MRSAIASTGYPSIAGAAAWQPTPFLRIGRMFTRSSENEVGRPFTEADWALCARHFPEFDHVGRELCTIPLMPLKPILPVAAQERLARSAWSIDERLLARFPGLRKCARITFLVLKKES